MLTSSLVKFTPDQTQQINDYYEQNGYVIVKKLLNETLVDEFIQQYNQFKYRFYPLETQDTHLIELLEKDEQEFLIHSIMNPKDLVFAKGFATAVEKCLTSPSISTSLNHLSGRDTHTIYQSMFFDKSTGTVAHQDHYYLDTNPPGHMIAAWFALEDIHLDAGCFFVIPGSHRDGMVSNDPNQKLFGDHENYVTRIQQIMDNQDYELRPCPLQKGDVLFWHPFTIHGAFNNIDPRYSRKSLTAHYMPDGYQLRHHDKYPATKTSLNPQLKVWKRNRVKAYLGFYKRCLQYALTQIVKPRPKLEMRSTEYPR